MDSLLNKPAVVSIILHDDTDRNFHGIINHIEEVETRTEGETLYRATMVPWTWLLTLFNDCRIFQNKSVPDIVQKVFTDRGFTDYANRLTGTYNPREYSSNIARRTSTSSPACSRTKGSSISSSTARTNIPWCWRIATAFVACPSQSSIAYDTTAGLWQDLDVVLSLRRTQRIRVGKYTENDYDFTKPRPRSTRQPGSQPRPGEFYEYPGKYTLARRRQPLCPRPSGGAGSPSAHHHRRKPIAASFRTGFKFTLTGYYRDDANQDYAMISRPPQGPPTTATSRMNSRRPSTIATPSKRFRQSTPYHPPRNSRRPFIQGSQTAVVVGKSGEEIWVDSTAASRSSSTGTAPARWTRTAPAGSA